MKPKVKNNLGGTEVNDKFYFHISECLSEFSDKIEHHKENVDSKTGGQGE